MAGDRDAGGLHEQPVRDIRRENGVTVIALAGELDLYNAQPVRDALATAATDVERVVVDLSNVTFIDSTAMGVLIEARARMANREAFVLASPGMETRRALAVSGLDTHFTIRESVADALAGEV